MTTCKISILEPFKLFRESFCSYFSRQKEFTVISYTSTVESLVQSLNNSKPDVVIANMLHFNDAGIRTLKKMRQNFSDLPVLLITGEDYSEYFTDYITLGVRGFVFKDDSLDEFVHALKKMLEGKTYLPQKMMPYLLKRGQRPGSGKFSERKRHHLTEREIAVLKLFCDGLTFKEVGEKLFISPRTVEAHKRNIMEKLNIRSLAEMIKYAARHQYTTV